VYCFNKHPCRNKYGYITEKVVQSATPRGLSIFYVRMGIREKDGSHMGNEGWWLPDTRIRSLRASLLYVSLNVTIISRSHAQQNTRGVKHDDQ
jgi:hypothetical protein